MLKNRLPLLLAFIGLSIYVLYISIAHPDIPYMNTIGYISDYARLWRRNPLLLVCSWPNHQQSGLIDAIYVYLNIRFFSLNILGACLLTGLVLAALFLLISHYVSVEISPKSRVIWLALLLGIFLACFSLNGWQLYTLDLGFPEYSRNLMYLFIILLAGRAIDRPVSRIFLALYLLLVFFSIVILGTGEVYAFSLALSGTIVLVYLQSRYLLRNDANRQRLVVVGGLPLLCITVYWLLSEMFSDPFHRLLLSSRILVLLPITLSTAVLSSEGARLVHWGTMDRFAVGFVMLCFYFFSLWTVVKNLPPKSWFIPAALANFGFIVAISIVIARGLGGVPAVGASRYYVNYVFFCVGVIWLLGLCITSTRKAHFAKVAFFSMFALCVILQSISFRAEWGIAPYRALAFAHMRAVILRSTKSLTHADARLLQVNSRRDAFYAISYAKRHHLDNL